MENLTLPGKVLLLNRCHKLSNLFSFIAFSFALIGILGRILEIPSLTYIHPSLPPMQANTSFALLLCSIGIPILNSRFKMLSFISDFIGATAFLLGAMTLAQYFFGLDLGIDRIFSSTPMTKNWAPGRPAPQTAANFIFLGLSIIFYHYRRIPIIWAQLLTLGVIGNSIFVFTGYVFSTKEFYGFPLKENFIGMAIHTSLAFIFLSMALLLSRPSVGLVSLATSPTRSGFFARKVFYTSVIAPPLLAVLTNIGVILGFYSSYLHVSLFVALLVGLLLWTTWIAAVKAESEELKGLSIFYNLRQSEERFELALNGADLAAWDWNIKTGSVIFNERWAQMRGYTLSEIKPHVDSWLTGIHKDDLPILQAKLKDYFEGVTSDYEAEFRVFTKSGKLIWILDKGKIFQWDVDGKPLRMLGTESEITEKKRIENEQKFLTKAGTILSSSIQYDETLKSVCDLAAGEIADICIVDILDNMACPVKRVVSTRDPALLKTCKELKKDSFYPAKPSLLSSVYESRSTIFIKHVDYKNLGLLFQNQSCHELYKNIHLESIVAVPLIVYGKVVGMLSFFKLAESGPFTKDEVMLAEKLGELAAFSINNANLYNEAKNATKVREEVLAIVSHDLKNPLNTIGLVAQMFRLSKDLDSTKISSLASNLDISTKQMKQLISNLLDFAKLQSGTFSVDLKPTNISEVINDVLGMLKLQINEKHQFIDFEIPTGLPDIPCDAQKLEQVFSNLLGNAIKFSPDGGKIKLQVDQTPEGFLVSVSDTGPGIASDLLPRIFDRFWQPQESRDQGSGLGLSIVKGIIEAHKGRIWVESALGKGSTFAFFLPLKGQ